MVNIKKWMISTMIVAFGAAGVLGVVYTQPAFASAATEITKGVDATGTSGGNDMNAFIKNIINTLLFVLGAIAVVMIVFGGIKFTTSNGNAEQVKSAKNTILYSVVGLVVAILAYAIVNFVVTNLT